MKVTVIITTYNSPGMLKSVLNGYMNQTELDFELIIADDGSTDDTKRLIREYMAKKKIKELIHCWQKDEGFRAGKIRNKAVMQAKGDYLIFSDGDCVPHSNLVERHKRYAETNFFLAGNRILLGKEFSRYIVENNKIINSFTFIELMRSFFKRDINRLIPLVYLPSNLLRYRRSREWRGVKTCNLSLWKKDFEKINGFDETYEGWGLEDSDLAIRLINSGVLHKSLKFAAPVFHLWHPENSRDLFNKNLSTLEEALRSKRKSALKGIYKNA